VNYDHWVLLHFVRESLASKSQKDADEMPTNLTRLYRRYASTFLAFPTKNNNKSWRQLYSLSSFLFYLVHQETLKSRKKWRMPLQYSKFRSISSMHACSQMTSEMLWPCHYQVLLKILLRPTANGHILVTGVPDCSFATTPFILVTWNKRTSIDCMSWNYLIHLSMTVDMFSRNAFVGRGFAITTEYEKA
jgi:hypothetical protein